MEPTTDTLELQCVKALAIELAFRTFDASDTAQLVCTATHQT